MEGYDKELPRMMEQMKEHFYAKGILVPDDAPLETGLKPYRFANEGQKKKNCWLHRSVINFSHKPGQFIVAVVADYALGNEQHVFKSEGQSYDEFDSEVVKKQIKIAKERVEKELVKVRREAADTAARLLGDAYLKPDHPYLKLKKISKPYGTRYSEEEEALLVPTRNVHGKLVGAQRIYSNGVKRFLPGQQGSEVMHTIPEDCYPEKEPLLILCEGFATGVSIYEATGKPVIVCFSADNLPKVAQLLSKQSPECAFIVAADDDRFTEGNPGKTAGEKGAAVSGGAVALPVFLFSDDESTDFNDLHCSLGLDLVKEQLDQVIKGFKPQYVRCLGYDKEGYFLTSSENKQVVYLRQISQSALNRLMPLPYWLRKYPKAKGGGVDVSLAESDLMAKCRQAGQYRASMVRGRGVWTDDKRLVVHLGDRLSVDGRETGLHDIKSRFSYVSDEEVKAVSPFPLELDEARTWIETIGLLRLRDSWAKMFLAGWPVQALLGGASKWRSHMHLTGESGAGKSTVLDDILWPVCRPMGVKFGGGVTEPGIRNRIGSGALVGIVDEMESRNKDAKQRIELVLDYIRQSSSGARVVKGAANGGFVEYSAYSSFVLASVQDFIEKETDATRFVQIHVLKRSEDPEQWAKLSKQIQKIQADEFSDRFFSRCVHRYPQFRESQELLFKVVAGKFSERIAQLYSGVLAGWNLMTSDSSVTLEEAHSMVAMIDSKEEKSTSQEKDWEEVLQVLLSTRIECNRDRMAIRDIIQADLHPAALSQFNQMGGGIPTGSETTRALRAYGLSIMDVDGSKGLFVMNGNTEIRKILKDTIAHHNYQSVFKSIPGAVSPRPRIEGKRPHGIWIPMKALEL